MSILFPTKGVFFYSSRNLVAIFGDNLGLRNLTLVFKEINDDLLTLLQIDTFATDQTNET